MDSGFPSMMGSGRTLASIRSRSQNIGDTVSVYCADCEIRVIVRASVGHAQSSQGEGGRGERENGGVEPSSQPDIVRGVEDGEGGLEDKISVNLFNKSNV